MEFHRTCKTLSIYCFTELIKTKDFRFLIKDFDEFKDLDTKIESTYIHELSDIYKDIVYEYAELTSNNKIISNFKSKILIKELEFRYNTTSSILNLFAEYLDVEILNTLNKLGWKFYKEKDIDLQLMQIAKSMGGLKTRISILNIKHDAKFKENEEEIPFVDSLDSDSVELELILKLTYSIDTRKTSVSKWIGMWNIAKIRNQQIKKSSKNG